VDGLIFFCALGLILGARIGWILFYGFEDIVKAPIRALRIWEGGMSFHGGLIGVVLAVIYFARTRKRVLSEVCDFTAALPALGLFAGRMGNFINGELWGKPTDLPWGFIVDAAKLNPKQAGNVQSICERFDVSPCVMTLHPSPLYEAVLEGLVIFAIVWAFSSKPRPPGSVSGLFLMCYGVFRSLVELVRIPDENRGYLLWGWVTEGQLLSFPMIVAGAVWMIIAYRRARTAR
jgi:phosphatidylglycerol:prolipoprotein diacylglycerol transferase